MSFFSHLNNSILNESFFISSMLTFKPSLRIKKLKIKPTKWPKNHMYIIAHTCIEQKTGHQKNPIKHMKLIFHLQFIDFKEPLLKIIDKKDKRIYPPLFYIIFSISLCFTCFLSTFLECQLQSHDFYYFSRFPAINV